MPHQNPGDSDTIQLFEAAVQHLLPPYANEDDMYEALDKCGLTQRQIFDELDRRFTLEEMASMSAFGLANWIQAILFDAFNEAIADVTAHKVPLQ